MIISVVLFHQSVDRMLEPRTIFSLALFKVNTLLELSLVRRLSCWLCEMETVCERSSVQEGTF